MSATEVIAEINKLPRAEQDKVYQYLVRHRPDVQAGDHSSVSHATDAQAEAAGDFVFREHAELLRRLSK